MHNKIVYSIAKNYLLKFKRSKHQYQLNSSFRTSKDYINQNNHYCSHHYNPIPVVINRGDGIYIYDIEGRRYYDFLSCYCSVNQGHCHPRLINVMKKQIEKLTITSRCYYNNLLGDYAQYATRLFGYDKILPMNTGVEGGETAIKLARKWAYKVKNVKENCAITLFANNNFWGRTLAAISTSNNPLVYKDYGPFMSGFKIIPYNDVKALEDATNDENVCAFMLEPIQGEAGVIIPENGYLKSVRQICSKKNVLMIADEVQTGLGRTGRRLCVDYENVRPDMVILGKSLSGGMYPISAVLADSFIMDNLRAGEHGSTYGGNPLGCAIAIEALSILEEEKLYKNSLHMGHLLRKNLKKLNTNVISSIVGKGLLNCLVLNKEISADEFCNRLGKRNLLTKPARGNRVRLAPPLIINKDQILESIDIISKVANSF